MTAEQVIAALDLPPASRVDRRVPKTLLMEHGTPTAADRRQVTEGVEQVRWVAALKPTTIGVAPYRDAEREYLEIAVLQLTLRTSAKLPRLIELLHRAVPYPVFAVVEQGDALSLSLAHKRWSQGEEGKVVLEGEVEVVSAPERGDPLGTALAEALPVGRQPRTSLRALYDGWIDTLLAVEAARRTGDFVELDGADRRIARREALRECARLQGEVSRIRAAAARERQMARQVALNIELKRVEAELAAASANL